ncbi:MAG: hypothetical protein JSV24_05100 [Bacteroidales bacterium]|nr:MAG: hypothetical protein JSV24_05100 [Bacteroidales bacterium]
MRTGVKIVLALAIIILGYLLLESIMQPIRFNRERVKRENATIERLIDIRTAQVAFKDKYQRYTGDFDSLINFVKLDSFPVVRAIGSISDSLMEAGMTESDAVKLGLIIRDTMFVSVLDSIFFPNYPIDSLRFIPYADTNQFFLGATEIETASKVKVNVFEAHVINDILLHGLDRQLIINYSAERVKITNFPGLRVGSLEEATNNAGNWE